MLFRVDSGLASASWLATDSATTSCRSCFFCATRQSDRDQAYVAIVHGRAHRSGRAGKRTDLRVAVAAVDHDGRTQASGAKLGGRVGDEAGLVVGAGVRSAHDDVRRVVARRLDDRRESLLGDRQEGVPPLGRPHRIDRDRNVALQRQ